MTDFLRPVENFAVIGEWARLWQDNNYCFRSYNVSCMGNAGRRIGRMEKKMINSQRFSFWLFLFPWFSAHGNVCWLSYGVLHSGILFSWFLCIFYAVLLHPTRFTHSFAVELNSLLAGYYW